MTGGALRPPRIGLVGGLHVGVETVFTNVRQAATKNADFEPVAIPIAAYRLDRVERWFPFLPKSTRGNLRYIAGTAPLFRDDLDVVWSLLDLPLLPWMLTGNRRRRVPVIFSTDSSPRQLRAFGELYGYWGGRSNAKFRVRDWLYKYFVLRVAAIQVYTEWAARSLRNDYGVPEDRIRVFPPGVDTDVWKPGTEVPSTSLPRLIFVGGDFRRKGGDLLLEVFRRQLYGKVELDLVTRPGAATPEPGVFVHTDLNPNDPRLVRLYQTASVLALPTRADCFSIAGLEAMATGIPVVTCPVGGVAEVLTDSQEGFYVPPDDGRALARALEVLVSNPDQRHRMGAAGRRLVLERYDARLNTRRLLNLVTEVRATPCLSAA